MEKYFSKAFALLGTATAIPNDVTVDGSVSFEQGYTLDYELDPDTDPNAKNIERAKINYLFKVITSNLKFWQENAFPEWIADKGDGNPFAYDKNTIVRYTDGKNYVSLEDDNTYLPTNTAYWNEFDLNKYVDTINPQTIGGEKLFTSIPRTNVSTPPTVGSQLTTKQYVDDRTPDATTLVKGLIELAINAEAQAGTSASLAISPATLFNSLKGSNQFLEESKGFQDLHGGFILQFGTELPGALQQTTTFKKPFPNACIGVFPVILGANAHYISLNSSPTLTQFTVNKSVDYSWRWFAIGF